MEMEAQNALVVTLNFILGTIEVALIVYAIVEWDNLK